MKKTENSVVMILVTGGCRSGKSSYAQMLAERIYTGKKESGKWLFVATCQADDAEMAERVARHQADRSSQWHTLEEPLHVADAINNASDIRGDTAPDGYDVILVDCLTLWVSNLMADGRTDTQIFEEADRLIAAINATSTPVILVTNEVGCGIVPSHPMSRRFRDIQGTVNQKIAAAASTVVWMVSGIPVKINDVRKN